MPRRPKSRKKEPGQTAGLETRRRKLNSNAKLKMQRH
jgi:hypothetical protein